MTSISPGTWRCTGATYSTHACKRNRSLSYPRDGLILLPHRLYLGVTEEYTETHRHVPFLEGKSSIGRLGIDIHATAGKGDIGFCNTWTFEISVRAGQGLLRMPIGELIHFEISGEIGTTYDSKTSAK